MPTLLEGKPRDLIDACRRGERDAFRALFEGSNARPDPRSPLSENVITRKCCDNASIAGRRYSHRP